MNCPGSNSVFLRANGKFVCWDDAGSDRVHEHFSDNTDFSELFSENGLYAGITERLARKELPFPETCPGCLCLSFRGSPLFRSGEIDVIQVEPSSRCTLSCKACATREERLALDPPSHMKPEVFSKILGKLMESGISVKTFDFSGHGEPTSNPDLWELVRIARESFPLSHIYLITNSNEDFREEHLSAGLNEIQFSIDGTNQTSYEKYRIGGDFAQAFRYMSSFTAAAENHPTKVRTVWRYILFAHNDSPDELKEAYGAAMDASVDELRFVFTHKGDWSRNIPDAQVLEKVLRNQGVPRSRIRMDSINSLAARRRMGDLLRRNSKAYRLSRNVWKRLRDSASGTIVTADFCQLNPDDIERALCAGWEHYRNGNFAGAQLIGRHVAALLELPSKHNPAYDSSETFGDLKERMEKLLSQAAAETHVG